MANSANSYINPTAQKEIADLINKQLDLCDFDFSVRKVTANDIRFNNRYEITNVLVFEEGADPIMEIFEKLSKNRYEDYGQFHHFKSSSIALDIIKNREIQVSSLFSNDKNDFAEYTEFYKRIGMFHPLVATDFQRKAFENKINPKDVRPSDIERDHIFVLCLTQDNHNERFWRNYASDDHGVAIGFRFWDFEDEGKKLYDFRDVFYDRGYSFDFYNAIDYELRRYNKMLFASGVDRFAKFYKRSKYNWENETRLCFHYDAPESLGLNKYLDKAFPIQTDEKMGRRYINLPFAGNEKVNPFFQLAITELVCGKYVPKDIVTELKAQLTEKYPMAICWQRP
jgi:hypothetical protein